VIKNQDLNSGNQCLQGESPGLPQGFFAGSLLGDVGVAGCGFFAGCVGVAGCVAGCVARFMNFIIYSPFF
jgi:hypothetical protein